MLNELKEHYTISIGFPNRVASQTQFVYNHSVNCGIVLRSVPGRIGCVWFSFFTLIF